MIANRFRSIINKFENCTGRMTKVKKVAKATLFVKGKHD